MIKMGSLNSDNRLVSGFCQVLCNSLGYVMLTHHKEFMAYGNILGQLFVNGHLFCLSLTGLFCGRYFTTLNVKNVLL